MLIWLAIDKIYDALAPIRTTLVLITLEPMAIATDIVTWNYSVFMPN